MADWNNPILTDAYTDFLSLLKDRDADLATMFAGSGSNLPTGAIKFDPVAVLFQKWSGSVWETQVLSMAGGGTGASTAAGARSNLGLGTVALDSVVPIARGGTGATDASAARTALGLGTMATQNANAVAITGGTIALSSPLPVASGGTGANSASAARSALGLGNLAVANSVSEGLIDTAAVTVNKIADGHVTAAKLQAGAALSNLGYTPASAPGGGDYRAWDAISFSGQAPSYYTNIPARLGYTPPLPPDYGWIMRIYNGGLLQVPGSAGQIWAWWYVAGNISQAGMTEGGFNGLSFAVGDTPVMFWRIR